MSQVNSFVKQFVAIIKGDDAEVSAQKAWRQAQSGLKTHIASLEGDTIKFEDNVTDAQENLAAARVNSGQPISNRDNYVSSLVAARNRVTAATKAHTDHLAMIAFLKEELVALETV